jgi:hypothetical protein
VDAVRNPLSGILSAAIAAPLLLLGCSKEPAASQRAPETVPSSTIEPPVSASPVISATAAIMPSAAASTSPSATSPAASTAHARDVKPVEAPQPVSTKVTGNHFTLDVASGGCVAGRECSLTLRLEASGGYHINQEYPYKVTMNAVPSVAFLSKDGSGVFSKAGNDLRMDSEHVATMTVRVKPASKGPIAFSGQYKMSVCSDANCQIEQTPIALVVPVM